jgi:esterase/lipase superfamily enzyme
MTSKNEKKNLKQNKRVPRISTRGFYDLGSGRTLKKKPYDLYPKKSFENLVNAPELVIMVHGLRNNKKGALAKFHITQRRLNKLGYKHPVVGFSYDSNIKGAQYKSHESRVMSVGRMMAVKNGRNLARFILDFKKKSPSTKIRLIGHSLGSEVIMHAVANLRHKTRIIEAVYFFGSSVPSDLVISPKFKTSLRTVIRKKILNYYNPNDEVLKYAQKNNLVKNPIGCYGLSKSTPKYAQKKINSKNHRFASYMAKITRFQRD